MSSPDSKEGIKNSSNNISQTAANGSVLSHNKQEPHFEDNEAEKRKAFSIELLTDSRPSCSTHRRRSATAISSKTSNEIKEFYEPPMKKTLKCECFENLHNVQLNEASLCLPKIEKSSNSNSPDAMILRNHQQFPQNQYQQHRLIGKQNHDEVPTNTFPITTSAWQQQLNLVAAFFIQQQSQQQELGGTATLDHMLARGCEAVTAVPSVAGKNYQLEELKKKMAASAAILPQFQLIMDAQQHNQNFLSFMTGVKDNSEGDISTAIRQNSLNEESPVGDESDEGDESREASDEEPPSSSGVVPSTKSFYSSKSELATGIRKKRPGRPGNKEASLLEAAFNAHRYLNSQQRTDLARTLNLTETQVKIWKRIIGTMDCNEPTDNQTNNNQKNNLSILPALPSLQHQNIEQFAVSNFPLTGVNGHYEQSSSINQSPTQQQTPTFMLQQAQRLLLSFFTSTTSQSTIASPPPSVLSQSFIEGGKENESKNFNSDVPSTLTPASFFLIRYL
uniref:Homeobox domain-containing protein n=1 Tax=Meloidogyne floridensis TaxID=298350 RepID=A0A915P8L8_9BILA